MSNEETPTEPRQTARAGAKDAGAEGAGAEGAGAHDSNAPPPAAPSRAEDARAAESSEASSSEASSLPFESRAARSAHGLALAGLALYAFFAPGSIAAAWIAISIATVGWLLRTFLTGRAGLRRTALDLPLWLLFGWTVLSAIFSAEPDVSLRKLPSAASFLFYYLAQSVPRTRREATRLASVMIAGAAVCTLWGVAELARGRGVVIDEIAADSPLRGTTRLREGDCVWRVGGVRVDSVAEIDELIRRAPAGGRLTLSVITGGEHVEWPDLVVTDASKSAPSPSGLKGSRRTHRFRVSGWTRHYETFAETLQIVAQLALGLALAHFARRGTGRTRPGSARRRALVFAAAFVLLACGIALTAMRTALVAFAFGALVTAWRAAGAVRVPGARMRARLVVAAAVACVLALGGWFVWRTRPEGALAFRDDSARLRLEVARVAASRVPTRPLFGHGMDAQRHHWTEWGFPGKDMLHMHSTPLQLAFDRGLPALLIWLWLVAAFWLLLTRAEKLARASTDAPTHGLLLGATGATAGFFSSSLVNYNFGDAEVALMLWWLMGTTVAVTRTQRGESY